MKVKRNQIVL